MSPFLTLYFFPLNFIGYFAVFLDVEIEETGAGPVGVEQLATVKTMTAAKNILIPHQPIFIMLHLQDNDSDSDDGNDTPANAININFEFFFHCFYTPAH